MSTIEWLRNRDGSKGKTWNPVVGCTRVSEGCDNCYAMLLSHRQMCEQHRGLTKIRPKGSAHPGVDWSGIVRTVARRLAEPLRWRKPQRVFVNSMSDLFHPAVPFEYIAAVFGVMAAARQHTFLALTKRDPRPFFAWLHKRAMSGSYAETSSPFGYAIMDAAEQALESAGGGPVIGGPGPWPLPNVHLGVSAENQATWDERVPLLLQCPAAVRWVSAEPLLGPIDGCTNLPDERLLRWHRPMLRMLDWVVVGGESGPGARPCNVEWIRSLVRQCRVADVPVFVKQLGRYPYQDEGGNTFPSELVLNDRKGKELDEWPADLRVRAYPEAS